MMHELGVDRFLRLNVYIQLHLGQVLINIIWQEGRLALYEKITVNPMSIPAASTSDTELSLETRRRYPCLFEASLGCGRPRE